MSIIKNQYWNFLFIQKGFFKITKNVLCFLILVLVVVVIEYSTYYYRQTDTFVKTTFSDRKDLMKISKVIFHIKLIPSHP